MATATELMTKSAGELQLLQRASEGASAIACLPAQVLYVAAQFASRDEAKQVLQLVCVRKAGDQIVITSTDGHRAFRFRLPASEQWYVEADELLLNAAPLRKRVPYACWALVRESGTVELLGGRVAKGSAFPPAELIEARPWKSAADCYTYPQVCQLWPDRFSNTVGGPIAWNASYLAQFLAEVTRYSHNGVVRMEANHPTTPLVFSSSCELPGLDGCELEYLLMPVQIRDWGKG
ncbi:DNA polymerase III beta subunit [Synechococcus phage S-SRP02]|nr:DNA polymerase III beta subunit [Synechococcus phage S-SRP02]